MKKIIDELKDELTVSINAVLEKLSKLVKKESELYDDLIVIHGNYNDLNREIHLNLISIEDKRVGLAKIRQSILYIITQINHENLNKYPIEENILKIEGDKAYDLEEEYILSNYNYDFEESNKNTFDQFISLLKDLGDQINSTSNKFERGAELVNRMKKQKVLTGAKAKVIDSRTAKDLMDYNYRIQVINPDFAELGSRIISEYLFFLQSPFDYSENIDNGILEKILGLVKDIGQTTKSIRRNLNGLNLELERLGLTRVMENASKKAISTNEGLIERFREFYFYIDKYEEELELQIMKKSNKQRR